MKTKTAVLNGKPDAGNPHVRFDEGEVASAKPRRGSLLYKKLLIGVCAAVSAAVAFAEDVDLTKLVREAGGEGVSYAVAWSAAHSDAIAADKCFNGKIAGSTSPDVNNDRWFAGSSVTSGWCTWTVLDGYVGDGLVVKTVRVLATSQGRAPLVWTLDGIDAEGKEIRLAAVESATKTETDFDVGNGKTEHVWLIEIPVSNQAQSYRKYKLSFGSSELQATEIQFWGEAVHQIVVQPVDVVVPYDGTAKLPAFNVLSPIGIAVTREYALSGEGPWSASAPSFIVPGDYRLFCRFSADGYDPQVASASLKILKSKDLCAEARASGAAGETYAVDGVASSGNPPANAWDGQMNKGDTGRWHYGSANGWTTFTFMEQFQPGEPIVVDGLSWEMQKDAAMALSRLPGSFTLYGSNDAGVSWTEIKAFSGVSWNAADLVDDVYVKRFDFDPVGSFRAYKVVDHANPAYAGEIRLFGRVGKVVSAYAEGWSGPYSGRVHAPAVKVAYPLDIPTTVEYAMSFEGPYSVTPPAIDHGTRTVYCRVTAEGYVPAVCSAVIQIEKPVYYADTELTEVFRQAAKTEVAPLYTISDNGTSWYSSGGQICGPSNAFNGVWSVGTQGANGDRWLRTTAVSATNPMTAVLALAGDYRAADRIRLKSYAIEIPKGVGREASAWTMWVRNGDDEDWVQVDSRSGISWSDADIDPTLPVANIRRKVFELAKPVRFRQMKFDLTGPSGGAALNEIRLYGDVEKVAKGLMLIIW